MRTVIRLLFFISTAVLFGIPAYACDMGEQALKELISVSTYDDALARISDPACLGDREAEGKKAQGDKVIREGNPLVNRFNDLTPDTKEVTSRATAVTSALKALADYTEKEISINSQPSTWRALTRDIQNMNTQWSAITPDKSTQTVENIAAEFKVNKWEHITKADGGEIVLDGQKFYLLAKTCEDKKQPCPAFESQRDLIRVVNLMAQLARYASYDSLAKHLHEAEVELQRWETYRSKGQHQYIWELWLNGQNMGEDLCPKDKGTGIQRGFCAVPTSQWIVLHPEAGLRWSHSAQQSGDLKPALIVELFGKYSWEWDAAPNQSSMTNRLGASLVAAYTNEPSGNKWSYGPMFHFGDGYNVAFTRSGSGTWGLLLNLNIADRYFGGTQKIDSYLKCLNKPNFGQLLQGQNFCN